MKAKSFVLFLNILICFQSINTNMCFKSLGKKLTHYVLRSSKKVITALACLMVLLMAGKLKADSSSNNTVKPPQAPTAPQNMEFYPIAQFIPRYPPALSPFFLHNWNPRNFLVLVPFPTNTDWPLSSSPPTYSLPQKTEKGLPDPFPQFLRKINLFKAVPFLVNKKNGKPKKDERGRCIIDTSKAPQPFPKELTSLIASFIFKNSWYLDETFRAHFPGNNPLHPALMFKNKDLIVFFDNSAFTPQLDQPLNLAEAQSPRKIVTIRNLNNSSERFALINSWKCLQPAFLSRTDKAISLLFQLSCSSSKDTYFLLQTPHFPPNTTVIRTLNNPLTALTVYRRLEDKRCMIFRGEQLSWNSKHATGLSIEELSSLDSSAHLLGQQKFDLGEPIVGLAVPDAPTSLSRDRRSVEFDKASKLPQNINVFAVISGNQYDNLRCSIFRRRHTPTDFSERLLIFEGNQPPHTPSVVLGFIGATQPFMVYRSMYAPNEATF